MLIIDRIEEAFAVCELIVGDKEETKIIIELSKLPDNVRSGDVLARRDGKYIVDEEETTQRRERILKLQNSLWE